MLALIATILLTSSPPAAGLLANARAGQPLAAAVWFDTDHVGRALVCVKYGATVPTFGRGPRRAEWVGHLEIGTQRSSTVTLSGQGTHCETFRASHGEEARAVADRPLRAPLRVELSVAPAVSPASVNFAQGSATRPVLVRRATTAGLWRLCVRAEARRGGPLDVRLRAGTSVSMTFRAEFNARLQRACWDAQLEAGGEFAAFATAPGGGDYLVEMLEFWRAE